MCKDKEFVNRFVELLNKMYEINGGKDVKDFKSTIYSLKTESILALVHFNIGKTYKEKAALFFEQFFESCFNYLADSGSGTNLRLTVSPLISSLIILSPHSLVLQFLPNLSQVTL